MKIYKLLIVFLSIIIQSCLGQTEVAKINGVSFVASRDTISEQHISPVVSVNANYAAVMPFGFIRGNSSSQIIYNTDRQWIGERKVGAKQYIKALKKRGINIMMKPQIWISRGEFTGYLKMQDEASWEALEISYSKFILDYAQLAEDTKSEILCIGTELEQFVTNRPEYWSNLILEIKKIYNGKLTYAANWDEFKRTPFWKDLDFIGVDAYFPVSDSKTPSVEECLKGWQEHKKIIKDLSKNYNRPVIFTEFGYRSVDYTGKEPWQSNRDLGAVNLDAQSNATKALFDSFWNEDWFAGGFIWKWFHKHENVGGENNNMFTPQNKPVETLIKEHYSNHK